MSEKFIHILNCIIPYFQNSVQIQSQFLSISIMMNSFYSIASVLIRSEIDIPVSMTQTGIWTSRCRYVILISLTRSIPRFHYSWCWFCALHIHKYLQTHINWNRYWISSLCFMCQDSSLFLIHTFISSTTNVSYIFVFALPPLPCRISHNAN